MKNGPKSFVFDSPLETLCFYIRNALFLILKQIPVKIGAGRVAISCMVITSTLVTISIYFHCLNSITLFHIKILFSILEKSKWLSINYIISSLYFSIPFLNSISKFYSRFWKRELSSTIRYFVQRFSPIFLTYPFPIRL